MPITVNGEPIDAELINQEFSRIKTWHEQRSQVSCCERDDEFLAEAKENVIEQFLLIRQAEKTIPPPGNEELDRTIDRLKKDCGGDAQLFAQTGLLPDQTDMLRRQIRLDDQVDRFIDQVCAGLPPISEEDLRRYYQDNIGNYTSQARVRALHIYKSLRQTEDKEALFAECCRVRQRLVDGEDFVTLASQFSDKPAEEVDLDWFKRGELMDEFEFVTFSMKIDEISPVFASYQGFHIAKVIGREPARARPFEEIKETVSEDLREGRRKRELKTYLTGLRKTADVQESEEPSGSQADDNH